MNSGGWMTFVMTDACRALQSSLTSFRYYRIKITSKMKSKEFTEAGLEKESEKPSSIKEHSTSRHDKGDIQLTECVPNVLAAYLISNKFVGEGWEGGLQRRGNMSA